MKKNSVSVISGHRRHVFELHWPIITPATDYFSPPTGANDFLSPHKTNVMSTVKHHLAVSVCVLSHGRLFATPRTVARQAPPSLGFPGKNTGMGCHFLLQETFPTQGSNPHLFSLVHWQLGCLPRVPLGSNIY